MPYDPMEAKDLLAKEGEKRQPDVEGRAKAAQALLDALVQLNDTGGFTIQRIEPKGAVVMQSGFQSITIRAHRDGDVVLADRNGFAHDKVPGLEFDRVSGELVGAGPDTFHGPPVPGKPTLRRSALAVVVEAALNAMFKRPG